MGNLPNKANQLLNAYSLSQSLLSCSFGFSKLFDNIRVTVIDTVREKLKLAFFMRQFKVIP